MTLAEILSLSLLAWALGVPGYAAQSPPPVGSTQQVPSSSTSETNATQNQGAGAKQASKTSSTSPQTKHAAQKAKKKTSANLNCPPNHPQAKKFGKHSANVSQGSSQATTSAQAGNSARNTGKDPSKAQAPTNCPPTITVIRNGGSQEPSIELLGGAGGQQASNEKTTTDQLLAATKENLDKVSGKNLSSSQQAMITQIQQFISESRESVAAGEMDRGRTLAMKAKLLSDELAKP